MIRVIIDTNVWISLLLKRSDRSTIFQVVAGVLGNDLELIVPQELIEELQTAIIGSAYLTSRILKSDVDSLIEQLNENAIILPVVTQKSQFTRDPKDDYLIVYSLLYAVDYLIIGDLDLLVLQKVGHLQIVTPSQFLKIL
jgi:uncharacterized protein